MSEPLFIYGNWSAYDELSDGIELTEELAMRQLQELLRIREKGVQFDGYLMDAFWFDPKGGYRTWRLPNWPNGPDAWFDACAKHNILPGLWFTVNTLCHIETASAWQESVDSKGWGMCLFEGGFFVDYLDVLHGWFERGVRIFKFDFADFSALPALLKGTIPSDEARARNIQKFRAGMLDFRTQHPEAILMGFNGFEEFECMDRTDRPLARIIDPEWLDIFDSMYCGDPRPADVPSMSFWRSVDIYADHMVRAFEFSGLPLHRIDNCGFMAGDTGTCYWRAKSDWKAMLLLSLARGGQVHVAYGDLALFSNEDAKWWAVVQSLYRPAMSKGRTESFGGIPGQGEPYGWISHLAENNLLTLINPSLTLQWVPLPRTQEIRPLHPENRSDARWSLVTGNPIFPASLSSNQILMGAGQIAVLGTQPLDMEFDLDDGIQLDSLGDPICSFQIETQEHRASAEFRLESEIDAVVIVSQFNEKGDRVRTYPTPLKPQTFQIVAEVDGVTTQLSDVGGKVIWSGMSWTFATLGHLSPGNQVRIHVETAEGTPVRISMEVRPIISMAQ